MDMVNEKNLLRDHHQEKDRWVETRSLKNIDVNDIFKWDKCGHNYQFGFFAGNKTPVINKTVIIFI